MYTDPLPTSIAEAPESTGGGSGAKGAGAISDKDAELLKKYLHKFPKSIDECSVVIHHLIQHRTVRQWRLLSLILILAATLTQP